MPLHNPVPPPATSSIPLSASFSRPGLVCVEDFAATAAARLPRAALDYYRAGATQENTLRENRDAFIRWYILPRMLRDVHSRCLTTTVLGHRLLMPVAVAPTAMQRMAHHRGECAAARAAGRHGIAYTLSTIATSSIEEVSEQAPDTLKFFQLYIYKNRAQTEQLVRRAEQAGYRAIVLTVDAPIFGIRRPDVRNNFALPPHLTMANFSATTEEGKRASRTEGGSGINEYVASLFDASITWEDLKWLVRLTTLPVVAKGILTRQDAKLAMQAGVAAVWVSNHGARQVDGVPPTIEALPHIVAEVGGRCPVFVDGGFTQGTDVFKALALGAELVLVGRPVLWGLACHGEDGVCHMLSILREELDNVMANTGCCSIQDISRAMVVRREHYAKL